jgi:ATP-dependent exoDNAse (exonuclease V) alpha subunit
MLQFHQNAKGFVRGQRVHVDGSALPLDQAQRFSVFRQRTLSLAPGDMIRISHNGFTADRKHNLINGSLHRVKSFNRRGDIVLDNGWTVAKDYGHWARGFVVTSHSSQGKTLDHVFLGQSDQSFPASSREQFYVSCSRGRHAVTVYCADKAALQEAISQSEDRPSALELINDVRRRELAAQLHPGATQAAERTVRSELVHER